MTLKAGGMSGGMIPMIPQSGEFLPAGLATVPVEQHFLYRDWTSATYHRTGGDGYPGWRE